MNNTTANTTTNKPKPATCNNPKPILSSSSRVTNVSASPACRLNNNLPSAPQRTRIVPSVQNPQREQRKGEAHRPPLKVILRLRAPPRTVVLLGSLNQPPRAHVTSQIIHVGNADFAREVRGVGERPVAVGDTDVSRNSAAVLAEED